MVAEKEQAVVNSLLHNKMSVWERRTPIPTGKQKKEPMPGTRALVMIEKDIVRMKLRDSERMKKEMVGARLTPGKQTQIHAREYLAVAVELNGEHTLRP